MMNCCDLPELPYIPCIGHAKRVDRDIKTLSNKFDLEQFRDFLNKNPFYCIEGYPKLIGEHIKFDIVIVGEYSDKSFFAVNSETKAIEMITAEYHKKSIENWREQADKDYWRDKLKYVGLNVNW